MRTVPFSNESTLTPLIRSVWTAALPLVAGMYLLFLWGCTGMNQQECLYADWYAKGLLDGADGKPMSQLEVYTRSCSKFAVTPDREEYDRGRDRGLESYCERDRGYEVGRRGGSYHGVCPRSLESQFLSGYSPGKELHDAESAITSIDYSIASKRSEIERLEAQINKFEDELLDDDTDQNTKETRLRQIKRRQSEITDRKYEIRHLLDDKVDAIVEYRVTVKRNNERGFPERERY